MTSDSAHDLVLSPAKSVCVFHVLIVKSLCVETICSSHVSYSWLRTVCNCKYDSKHPHPEVHNVSEWRCPFGHVARCKATLVDECRRITHGTGRQPINDKRDTHNYSICVLLHTGTSGHTRAGTVAGAGARPQDGVQPPPHLPSGPLWGLHKTHHEYN